MSKWNALEWLIYELCFSENETSAKNVKRGLCCENNVIFQEKRLSMSIGIPEIILIVVVVLLLFGAKRIPELARSLGKAQNEYKKAKDALKEEAEDLQKTVEKAAEADASSSSSAEKE